MRHLTWPCVHLLFAMVLDDACIPCMPCVPNRLLFKLPHTIKSPRFFMVVLWSTFSNNKIWIWIDCWSVSLGSKVREHIVFVLSVILSICLKLTLLVTLEQWKLELWYYTWVHRQNSGMDILHSKYSSIKLSKAIKAVKTIACWEYLNKMLESLEIYYSSSF